MNARARMIDRRPSLGEQFITGPVPDCDDPAPRIAWAGADRRCETATITGVHERGQDASQVDVSYRVWRGAAAFPEGGGELGCTWEQFVLAGWSRP